MLFDPNHKITVAYKLSSNTPKERIEQLVKKYGLNLVPAETLTGEEDIPLLRITKNQLYLEQNNHTLFFHPNMSLLRMVNIKRGMGDRFLTALGITEGESFLDATMGLASDALIASWAVGEKGKVLASENSPLIFVLVKEGLENFARLKPPKVVHREKEEAWQELTKVSSRIDTVCADHNNILESLPDSSVDVIYFDPMFRNTIARSSSIQPLKEWSNSDPLRIDTIQQACRVARKRIVLKERKNSGEFSRLGFKLLDENRYSLINFGTIELTEKRGDVLCSP